MTSFIDVYAKSMTQLSSPLLSRLQSTDLYSFCLLMQQYLEEGMIFYGVNVDIEERIVPATDATNGVQSFVGNNTTKDFVITNEPSPTEDSIFKITLDDVATTAYTFDSNTNTISFTTAPASNVNIQCLWYNDGEFSDEFTSKDAVLLSLAICWAWAIQNTNDALDINRKVNDSDFKLHSEGQTLNAKVNWVTKFEEMFKRELSKADWTHTFRRLS